MAKIIEKSRAAKIAPWLAASLLTCGTVQAAAPGGVETRNTAKGVYFEFREGYTSTPENGIGNGFFRARGYADNVTDLDDVMLNEDATSISMRILTRIEINNAGNYQVRFVGLDDDGAIFVGGTQRLVGNCCGDVASGNFFLSNGSHLVDIRWSENGGGERLWAQYRGPDTGGNWANFQGDRVNVDNLRIAAWYRADSGVGNTGNNSIASGWADSSGMGNNLSTQSGHDPRFHSTTSGQLLNFNPVVNFSDDRMNGPDFNNGLAIDRASRTAIVVAAPSETAGGFRWISGYGRDSDRAGFGLGRNGTGGEVAVHNTGFLVNNLWATNVPNAIMGIHESPNANSGNNVSIYNKGQLSGSTRRTDWRTQLNDNADIAVGTATDSGSGWNGRIAEVIYYPWALNAEERRRVFSYIGIKYGIHPHASLNTLTNSQGQVIYDMDDNNNGSLDWGFVAGIMRDDASSLNQRISRSQTDFAGGLNGELTVSTDNNFTNPNNNHANTLSNGQSLVWGAKHQNINSRSANVDLNVYSRRSSRYWKFTDVGGVGNVNLRFNNLPALPPGGRYVMLRDTDENFTSGTTEVATSTNGTFTNVNFPDNQTFFIAIAIRGPSVAGVAPGNTMMWLRSDSGTSTTTDGQRVGSWTDRTVFANNANTGVPVNQSASYRNNTTQNLNFHPAIEFDGTQDFYNIGTVGFPFGNSARSTFIVVNSDTGNSGGFRFPYAYGTASANQAHFVGKNNATVLTGGFGADITSGNFWQAGETRLVNATYNGTTARLFAEGQQLTSGNRTWNTVANVAYVGRQVNGNEHFDGRIAEIIQYNKELNQSERKRVESYLALKYGLTLDASANTYVNRNNATIFDVDDNDDGTQDWDLVAGLFREDQFTIFTQRIASAQTPQNRNLQTSLTVSTDGNFTNPNNTHALTINDGDSLVWGASPVAISDDTSSDFDSNQFTGRLTRIWKFQDTGAVGNVNLRFDNLPGLGSGGSYFLLRDTDQNFASGSTVIASNQQGIFNNVNLPDNTTTYLALAFVRGAVPGGVSGSLRLWLTADQDTAGDGTAQSPFTSLNAAHNVTSPGIYHFRINGQSFSTYVDVNGWVLAISGEGSTTPAQYGQTANLTLQSDRTLPQAVFNNAFSNVNQVRINATAGGGPTVDILSTNATVLNRLRAYTTLTYQTNENDFWEGPGSGIRITCNPASESLARRIYHSCGNGGGLHWLPAGGLEGVTTSNSNDLNLWVRIVLPGQSSNVGYWNDRSGEDNHLRSDTGKQPFFESNAINFHPAISFRGIHAMYRSSGDVLDGSGDDASTILAVVQRQQVTAGVDDIVSFTGGGITATQDRPALGFDNNTRLRATIFDGSSADRTHGTNLGVGRPYVLALRMRNVASPDGVRLSVNGIGGEQTFDLTNPVNSSNALVIGAENNNLNDALYGDVSEVMIFGETLDDNRFQSAASYLALKYGITLNINTNSLSSNYTDENGNSVYDVDDSNNGGYDWIRVAGLFKNQSGSANQRVARSQEDGAAVSMSTDGDFANPNDDHSDTLNPGQYLIWGSKAPAIGATTTANINTANYAYRLDRRWKVQNTNSVGAVHVWVEVLPDLLPDQQYVLLGSNSESDFSNPSVLGTAQARSGIFNNVTFPDGVSYFTVAVTISQQNGSSTNPFTNLRSARSVTTAGTYHFNINGNVFSTHVDNNGWVLMASGAAATAPATYGQTSNLTLQSDRTLPPAVFHSLSDVNEVRINATSGPAPATDMVSTNPTVITRLIGYSVLAHRAGDQNHWTGPGASTSIVVSNAGDAPLNQQIYHSNGTAGGLHWLPFRNDEHTAFSNRGGTPNDGRSDLNLWARGTNLITSSPTGEVPASAVMVASAQSAVLNFGSITDLAAPSLFDFRLAGIDGVTSDNLSAITQLLRQLPQTSNGLLSELQSRVNALLSLQSFLNDPQQVLSPAWLTAMGFTGVDQSIITELTAALREHEVSAILSDLNLIQRLIDSISALRNTLSAIANNRPNDITLNLLKLVMGLDDLLDNAAPHYAAYLAGQNTITDLDSLKTYIARINRLVRQAADSAALVTQGDLNQLGVTGVTTSNLSAIQNAIAATADDASALSSLTDLQALVDQTIANLPAPEPVNPFANLTVESLVQSGVTGATDDNIEAIREALFQALLNQELPLDAGFIGAVQDVVNQVVSSLVNPLQQLLDAISNNNQDAITLSLLNSLSLENVIAEHLAIYQALLIQQAPESLTDNAAVQTVVNAIYQHILALQEILEDAASGSGNANNQAITLNQLQAIQGLTRLTSTLLEHYQLAIAQQDQLNALPTLEIVQNLINEVNTQQRQRDTDGDGVSDILEALLNYDPASADSPVANGGADGDLDLLSAAREFILGTDDLNIDSNGNQTLDTYEDTDQDGLPDITEFLFGTNPRDANQPVMGGDANNDSDNNGIHDSVETFLEQIGVASASLTSDFDNDGISDVEEINQGSDPLKANVQTATTPETPVTSGSSTPVTVPTANSATGSTSPAASAQASGGSGSVTLWVLSSLLLLWMFSLTRKPQARVRVK